MNNRQMVENVANILQRICWYTYVVRRLPFHPPYLAVHVFFSAIIIVIIPTIQQSIIPVLYKQPAEATTRIHLMLLPLIAISIDDAAWVLFSWLVGVGTRMPLEAHARIHLIQFSLSFSRNTSK